VFVFLAWAATLVPSVTVPISLIGTRWPHLSATA
jgi:multidrug efflux pump subunit AcrB